MSLSSTMPSFSPGFSYGLPVLPVQANVSGTNNLQSVLTANNFVSYLTVLAVMNSIGSKATQRIVYKKAVKDYQTANGVDFTGRFINSLAFTTPFIVYWQEIASPAAQAKSQNDKNLYQSSTYVKNWYQVLMDLRIGTESHTCEESVPNPRACEESVPNPHAFYVKNRYQIITDVKNCYELFTYVSDRPPLDELTGICVLPLDEGEGVEVIERIYYDKSSDTCKEFTYKGSGGNDNKFVSLSKCQLACRPFSSEGKAALRESILMSQMADCFVFLADTIFGSLGTTIYTIAYKVTRPEPMLLN